MWFVLINALRTRPTRRATSTIAIVGRQPSLVRGPDSLRGVLRWSSVLGSCPKKWFVNRVHSPAAITGSCAVKLCAAGHMHHAMGWLEGRQDPRDFCCTTGARRVCVFARAAATWSWGQFFQFVAQSEFNFALAFRRDLITGDALRVDSRFRTEQIWAYWRQAPQGRVTPGAKLITAYFGITCLHVTCGRPTCILFFSNLTHVWNTPAPPLCKRSAGAVKHCIT